MRPVRLGIFWIAEWRTSGMFKASFDGSRTGVR